MATIATAVAAASTAFSTFHLSKPLAISRTHLRTIITSSTSSSSPSTTEFNITFSPPTPKAAPKSDPTSEPDQDDQLGQQLYIPWIVRDESGNLTLQSTPPARLLHAMAHASTSSPAKKKQQQKERLTSEPKHSKVARRFYNQNFRDPPQRLSKVLAAAGVASRRSSEELIFEGLVTVNGSVCNTPQGIIYVNGNRLPKKLPPKVYFAMNKPKGFVFFVASDFIYICSSGEKDTKYVVSLFDDYLKSWDKRNPGRPKPRLFTVGRLDVATTGLIIVTNDGDHLATWCFRYIATIEGAVNKRHLIAISHGTIIDGVHCTPLIKTSTAHCVKCHFIVLLSQCASLLVRLKLLTTTRSRNSRKHKLGADMRHILEMDILRVLHELTHNTHCVCNVRPSETGMQSSMKETNQRTPEMLGTRDGAQISLWMKEEEIVHEGRNHEVRELVKKAGLQIHSLKRVRIGAYRLPPDL
ncbi:hypothetical protein RJ639_042378, partial [Escallonia herrerae]